MPEDSWETIIRLQQEVKRLVLLAEESELTANTFLQPTLEQRSALDHICRAKTAELGFSEHKSDPVYIQKQYDKAKGHLYRAFYDVADWLETALREKILHMVRPYNTETLKAVAPEYYRDIRPRIEELSKSVANLRAEKDIGQGGRSIIEQIDDYGAKVNELSDIYGKLHTRIPGLEEHKKKLSREQSRERSWQVLKLIISALLGAVLTYAVIAYVRKSSAPISNNDANSPIVSPLQ